MHIALVEDDPAMLELLVLWLEEAGHDCVCYREGQEFIRQASHKNFDVVLLDWLLPNLSGEQILSRLKHQAEWDTPIVFVTARDSEEDMVRMLNQGADDYLVKPIHQPVLMARINAVTRRSHKAATEGGFTLNEFRVDPESRLVTRHEEPIKLTDKEFKLVTLMFQNMGRLLSRDYILSSVWGYDASLNTRTVDTHVSRIRKKLELFPEQGWRLSSIYHQGYRLEQISAEEPGSATG
ncbi:response regulator transcription factor [Thiohalophilus thiocyanatoxydans]|uniref:DNA-binding response OmpR family regulator n=1 Tax=Thiohalophilus thiocyanatoxydans TaxID=381308 RepID=A0A4R8INV4_9GAMM|nr:response regulator transcription factor [Thiohalophilus thiocyanatoxydans]TDX98147.1 DNA-binding response OmpR family regulator [Thiohalophilus thiocyanatoxydans]